MNEVNVYVNAKISFWPLKIQISRFHKEVCDNFYIRAHER